MSDHQTTRASPPPEAEAHSPLSQLFPAGLMLALTLIAYHPLTWQSASKTIGGRVDKYIFLWDLWWVKHALFHVHCSPFRTDFLFHPEGCSLAFHTLCTTNGLFGLLAGPSANLILTYNILLLLSTFLGGFFTFLLLRTMSGYAPGALLGGVIFVFSPPLWTVIQHGQMNLWSIQWMPLFLWMLVRFLRRPDRGRAAMLALGLAAVFYTGFQQVVFTALLALMIVPAELRGRLGNVTDRRALVRGATTGLVLALLLSAPLTVEMIGSYEGAMIEPGQDQMRRHSIRLQRLFSQPLNRWWRDWDADGLLGPLGRFLDRAMPRRGPMFGHSPCLLIAGGWIVLFLRRRIGFPLCYWSLMTVVLAWLSLGTDSGLLLQGNLPGLSAIRALYRFCIPLALSLAILSAFLCRGLFGESPGIGGPADPAPRKSAPAWKPAICLLLALVTYLEFLKAPLKVSDPPPVPTPYLAGGVVHEAAAGGESAGALIELPYWTSGGDFWIGTNRYETLYHQTFHQIRMVGGHHSRMTRDQVPRAIFDPTLIFLSLRRPEGSIPPGARQAEETFRRNRIRFATLTRKCYTAKGETMIRRFLEHGPGGELVHEDREVLTYRFDSWFPPSSPAPLSAGPD